MPLAPVDFDPHPLETPISQLQTELAASQTAALRRRERKMEKRKKDGHSVTLLSKPPEDPLSSLKIQQELKRQVRENIVLQRMIGSYVGKRHAMNLPVRGQTSQSNAKTAKKLNHVTIQQQY
jgi:small subunit ribosomal protein S13